MNNNPIGIFDSGIGGLSVTKEVLKLLPNENIIYYGDTKRAPYGVRPPKEIVQFSLEIAGFLIENKCKALVIACNTICCYAIDAIKQTFNIPVIEVINPSVREAVKSSKTGVGIFATNATIASGIHKERIQKQRPGLHVEGVACPLFVNIVELGFAHTGIAYEAAKEYFKPLKNKNIDSLILGCTHFPIMKDQIIKAVGNDILIIDPSLETAKDLHEALKESGLLNLSQKPTEHLFCCSGDEKSFKEFVNNIIGNSYNIRTENVQMPADIR